MEISYFVLSEVRFRKLIHKLIKLLNKAEKAIVYFFSYYTIFIKIKYFSME